MQVLIKRPVLHGNISELVKVDVISSEGADWTIRLNGKTMQVKAVETIPLTGPGNTRILSSRSPARGSFANGNWK